MSLDPDSSHGRKPERLFGSSSGLRKCQSNSHEDGLTPLLALGERSVPIPDSQLRESQVCRSQSPSPHAMPPTNVEDHSIHHHWHGDNCEHEFLSSTARSDLEVDYSTHKVQGTANYIGNVTNASLGTNSGERAELNSNTMAMINAPSTAVTIIDRAFFSSGNGKLGDSPVPVDSRLTLHQKQPCYGIASQSSAI